MGSWEVAADRQPARKMKNTLRNKEDFTANRPYRISVVELTRIVRFHLDGSTSPLGCNGYAGRPGLSKLVPMVEVHITLRGEPDPKTHYVLDIKKFDHWANEYIFPVLSTCPESTTVTQSLRNAFQTQNDFPHELISIKLQLSPYVCLSLDATMPNVPPTLTFTQTYDFAAAHYLWAHDADEKENRSLYGKCSGIHGHNYQVEVVVEPQSNDPVPADKLDHLVTEHLLDAWDHQVLNELDDFQDVPPSVERIAQMAAARLVDPLAASNLKLREVSVSETDRTRARVRLG